jgi:hypothetical protein
VRYHPSIMLSKLTSRLSGHKIEDMPAVLAATASEAIQDVIRDVLEEGLPEFQKTPLSRTIGWLTAGLGAVALGLFVGRELRQRYKFNRRTPYDFYAHSADETQDMEFGVGI